MSKAGDSHAGGHGSAIGGESDGDSGWRDPEGRWCPCRDGSQHCKRPETWSRQQKRRAPPRWPGDRSTKRRCLCEPSVERLSCGRACCHRYFPPPGGVSHCILPPPRVNHRRQCRPCPWAACRGTVRRFKPSVRWAPSAARRAERPWREDRVADGRRDGDDRRFARAGRGQVLAVEQHGFENRGVAEARHAVAREAWVENLAVGEIGSPRTAPRPGP